MPSPKLPPEVVRDLPDSIDPGAVTRHAAVSASLDGPLGDTILMIHRGELAIATRPSGFEPFTVVSLDHGTPPQLDEGDWESFLVVTTADAQELRLRVSSYEKEPVRELLAAIGAGTAMTIPVDQPPPQTPAIEAISFEPAELEKLDLVPSADESAFFEDSQGSGTQVAMEPAPSAPRPVRSSRGTYATPRSTAAASTSGGGKSAVLALSFVVMLVLAGGGVAFFFLVPFESKQEPTKTESATSSTAPQAVPPEVDKGPPIAPMTPAPEIVEPPEHPAPAVNGLLDQGTIERIISRHDAEIRRCSDVERQSNPELSGTIRLEVRFTIATDGRVASARVNQDLIGGQLGTCVTNAVRRWRFPAPSAGVVSITWPFVFNF